MKYQVTSVRDKNGWDVFIDVNCVPHLSLFGGGTTRKFFGSGSSWWEIVKDRFGDDKEERASEWWSSWLHDAWWEHEKCRIVRQTSMIPDEPTSFSGHGSFDASGAVK